MKLFLPFDREGHLKALCSRREYETEFEQCLKATLAADPNAKKHRAKVTREVTAELLRPDGWFEQALREKYGCVIDLVSALVSRLPFPDNPDDLPVSFYTSFFARVPSVCDVWSRPMHTVRVALERDEADGFPFWALLEKCGPRDTVFVVLDGSESSSLCFQEQFIKLYTTLCRDGKFPVVAFIPLRALAPEQTLVLSEFAALTGGLVFPEIAVAEEALKEFLSDPVAVTLRRDAAKKRKSVHGFARPANAAILSLVPQTVGNLTEISAELDLLGFWALRLLSASPESAAASRRWARGLRVFRESALGLRDVTFFEPGDLGMEIVARPWRIQATFPPASSLGLERNTEIAAIHGQRLTDDFTVDQLLRGLARRPVVVTFRLRKEATSASSASATERLIHRVAVDVASEVLERRAQTPWPKLPAVVTPSASTASAAAATAAVVNGDVEQAIAWSTLQLGFDATEQVVDVRKVGEECLLRSSRVYEELRVVLDALTPMLFAISPSVARKLRNEGVALEVLFGRWLLRQSYSRGNSHACSMWRLAVVFALRVTRLPKEATELEEATKQILAFPTETSDAELDEARQYPIDAAWADTWWR